MDKDVLGCGTCLLLAMAAGGLGWALWPGWAGVILAGAAITVIVFGIGAFSQCWNPIEMVVIAVMLALLWLVFGLSTWDKVRELEAAAEIQHAP